MKLSDVMVLIEGGKFRMGDDWDGPEHDVVLSDFYIGKYQVTQAQFEAVMGFNKSFFKYMSNPVETVCWYDAVTYCNKLSDLEGLQKAYKIEKDNYEIGLLKGLTFIVECDFKANGYRLPTEAEWEYAAKGGKYSKGCQYSGSRDSEEVGWFQIKGQPFAPHPVGEKKPNELGLYDMTGNVWEWCWDWFDEYSAETQTDPTGPETGIYKILRGGSWFRNDEYCLVTARKGCCPYEIHSYCGFRIVKNVE